MISAVIKNDNFLLQDCIQDFLFFSMVKFFKNKNIRISDSAEDHYESLKGNPIFFKGIFSSDTIYFYMFQEKYRQEMGLIFGQNFLNEIFGKTIEEIEAELRIINKLLNDIMIINKINCLSEEETMSDEEFSEEIENRMRL